MASKEQRVPTEKRAESKTRFGGRSKLLYWLSTAILVVIIITFIGAPVATGFGGGTHLVFGRYDRREIVYSPGNFFARRYQQIAEQTEVSSNDAEFQFQLRQIWRQAFNDTVFHTAVLIEAERAGLLPSQELVDRTLAQHPVFQEDGRFSAQRYRTMPQQERQSLRNYLRDVLIQQQFIQDHLEGARTASAETAFVAAMTNPERQFRYAAFPFTEIPDELVIQYAQDNPHRFQEAQLSRITVRSSSADAERIRAQLADRTAGFEDLAQAHSVDAFAAQGGEMGWTFYHQLEPDFLDPAVLDQVFSLGVGEVSPVLAARDSWMMYRLNEPVRNLDITTEEAVTTVRRYMSAFERGLIEDFLSDRAESFRAQAVANGIDAAASEFGIALRESAYFPINFGNVPLFSPVRGQEGNLLQGGAFREDFFRELFALSDGELSQPITLQGGTIVASFAGERNQSEDDLSFLKSYYPFVVQQFQAEALERGFIDPDRLTDNFAQAFNRHVLGN
ncbi:MAG: hypothetical protein EA403_05135 [Spirochaetaceae bacterium]|nr:MAG: hypothetical protein EA403_05135 [Spirochaetaceae bacterium]